MKENNYEEDFKFKPMTSYKIQNLSSRKHNIAWTKSITVLQRLGHSSVSCKLIQIFTVLALELNKSQVSSNSLMVLLLCKVEDDLWVIF